MNAMTDSSNGPTPTHNISNIQRRSDVCLHSTKFIAIKLTHTEVYELVSLEEKQPSTLIGPLRARS